MNALEAADALIDRSAQQRQSLQQRLLALHAKTPLETANHSKRECRLMSLVVDGRLRMV